MAVESYEIRTGDGERIEHVSQIDADGNSTSNPYAVYELWAIHDDKTEVFVCAHFGGCSHMSIHQLKEYFENKEK